MEFIQAAAIEVPTGIPTGAGPVLPPGVGEAATRLVSDGGILGALLVLALAAIVLLAREMHSRTNKSEAAREAAQKTHDDDREEWQRQIESHHEKRVAELRDLVAALNNSTASMAAFSQTQADRTATLHELASKLESVALIARNNSEMIDRNLKVYQDRIGELAAQVRELLRVSLRAGSGNGGV
ncbi:hypothetical protein [Methylobacterium trifolii]|uniref:Uncharacterized protein n=1 Tax=Methylobacterium trifolii TaxID=1003092 RepID=A0ABQ4U4J0_9HYPH|nr:hypothetical protein [Methylobacterium trifolii]GJE61686.1 hypothetical protein MPOCJGCO_3809 [Methylobacterium trifolii]